ncbi:hypothetical protein ACFO0N_16330 [Halobium salinum]|uniref:DUF3817 domain-containing protein n=1 Tax=Halobium salinum TaxID=1364940 RepID=A0ABD5PGC9_9EURY|nr:hypothetical protein [Halobium salinum]
MQRRVLKQFAQLTVLLHACMAVFVLVDAVRTGRDKRWALGTLVLGLPAVLPYLGVDAVRSRLPGADLDPDDLAFDESDEVDIDVADDDFDTDAA